MTDSWEPRTVARHLLGLFPRFHRVMARRFQAMTDEDETTLMRGFTLIMLIEDESMTVSDLARKRHVSLQSASKLVQSLVEAGWVTRARDLDDRRQYRLEVTEAGKSHARNMQHMYLNDAAEVLSRLTDEEIAAAQVFLPALTRILDESGLSDFKHRCG